MQWAEPAAIASIELYGPTWLGVASERKPPAAVPSCEKALLPQPKTVPYLASAIQNPEEPQATSVTPPKGVFEFLSMTWTGYKLSFVRPFPSAPFAPAPQVQTAPSASSAASVPPPAVIDTTPVR